MAFPTDDPVWATQNTYPDGNPNKIQPSQNLQDYGYSPTDVPTAEELNWQLNNIYQQIVELKNLTAGAAQTPVGELKFIVGDSRNPAIIYGYGTWVPYAEGRVIIGAGTGTDINGNQKSFSEGSTGGEYDVTLTESEIPQHTHKYRDRYYAESPTPTANVPASNKETNNFINGGIGSGDTDYDNNTFVYVDDTTGNVGGGQPHNNLPPYIACYIWLRTA